MPDISQTVAVIVPHFRPGACGLSDYSLRMARLLKGRGIKVMIAAADVDGRELATGEMVTEISIVPAQTCVFPKGTLLAFQ